MSNTLFIFNINEALDKIRENNTSQISKISKISEISKPIRSNFNEPIDESSISLPAIPANSANLSNIVRCHDCEHFIPDNIGNASGIGSCNLGMIWTQEVTGRLPLYCYANRHCVKFSRLMD